MLERYLRTTLPNECVGEFIHRDEAWLDFNLRVLDCAASNRFPLNERWNFLSITSSNLEEYISVRLGLIVNVQDPVYDAIIDKISQFIDKQFVVYTELKEATTKNGVEITKVEKCDKHEKKLLKEIFFKEIFTIITPVAINSVNDIPNILSGTTCIVSSIKQDDKDGLSIIKLHSSLPKIIDIGGKVVLLEDLVSSFLKEIYVNKDITEFSIVKVIKNLNITLEKDNDKFIIDRMNDTLLKRRFSSSLLLLTNKGVSKQMKKVISDVMDVPKSRIFSTDVVDYRGFSKPLLPPEFSFKKFKAPALAVTNEEYSMFSMLNDGDIMLHHPYDSYETVLKFIDHASTDPDVLSIKITLYRVSSIDSPIVNALVEAAERGKLVTALVEIKARFDEDNNLKLVSKLRNSGVNVILGIEELKTHCKMCIVSKRTKNGIKIYSHLATGNYNENTAKVYTDVSLLTSKQKLGMDLINVFNLIAGISSPDEKLQRVFYSPVNLRARLEKMIDREIDICANGGHGMIIIKVNSVSDTRIINKLYTAADAGVKIEIICRGVCSIIPRENIKIKSIVGRFLEHSRIYYFNNNGKPESYIASADLLTRNLDRRVELMVPITEDDGKNTISNILQAMRKDKFNSYRMTEGGYFVKEKGSFSCHDYFMYQRDDEMRISIPSKKK